MQGIINGIAAGMKEILLLFILWAQSK